MSLNVLNKVRHVIAWAKEQMEEYESLVDTRKDLEGSITEPCLSGRGLPAQQEEEEHDEEEGLLADDGKGQAGGFTSWITNLIG